MQAKKNINLKNIFVIQGSYYISIFFGTTLTLLEGFIFCKYKTDEMEGGETRNRVKDG